jgi:hypothetical protein
MSNTRSVKQPVALTTAVADTVAIFPIVNQHHELAVTAGVFGRTGFDVFDLNACDLAIVILEEPRCLSVVEDSSTPFCCRQCDQQRHGRVIMLACWKHSRLR